VKSTYEPVARARPTAPHVTRRQLEILRLIADGHNDHQIGERLNISHHTVRLHNSAMYAALEATGRAHAVAIAYRTGLLNTDARSAQRRTDGTSTHPGRPNPAETATAPQETR
jgi:DNA-binding CsgD family transcriptional regulator